jgi:hypothetical protein
VFFFRHPRPVADGRAVAVQIAEQKTTAATKLDVLVIPGSKPVAAVEQDATAALDNAG